jgi:glycosyltransferase involved in cell wall biosynthesis
MPTASIVIRTLNEAKFLGQLLEGVETQRVTDLQVETVLVDSGSTDGTLDIARRHGCRIVTISREEFSFGRSLNLGCDAAWGDILVFVSGHCVPANDRWLQELCAPLTQGLVAYVYGRQIGGPGTQFSEKQIFGKYFPEQSQIPQSGFYCNNANAAILRSAWSARRFDEELTGLEDMHLAKRLVADGQPIGYAADAVVYHLHDETWEQVRRRFEREALALQQIMPHVHIRQRDLIRYILSSIRVDMKKARAEGVLTGNAMNIIRYRYHQYVGSYLGNRVHQHLSHADKERYFYPDDSEPDRVRPRSKTTAVADPRKPVIVSDD